jgi:hypothetical protein
MLYFLQLIDLCESIDVCAKLVERFGDLLLEPRNVASYTCHQCMCQVSVSIDPAIEADFSNFQGWSSRHREVT